MSIFKRIANVGKGVAKTTARDLSEAASEVWDTLTGEGEPPPGEAEAAPREEKRKSAARVRDEEPQEDPPAPEDFDPLKQPRKRTL